MSASEVWIVPATPAAMDPGDSAWLERWLAEMLGIRVRLALTSDGHALCIPREARVIDLGASAVDLLGTASRRLRRREPGARADAVLDTAVRDLGGRLDRRWPDLAREPWVPAPYRCALVLTHDVDAVDRWSPQHVAHLAQHVRERLGFEGVRALLRLPWAAVRRLWDRPAIDARIRACLDLERHHGVSATYLFFSPEIRYRTALDGWYTPTTRCGGDDLASLWRRMDQQGFDVGLHLSIGAHGDRGAVAAEWHAVRAYVPSAASCRSHYLKVVPAVTADALASVGVSVDLNLVAMGYLHGTGAPFRHGNAGTYCLPTVIEDSALSVDGDPPAVLERVWEAWLGVLNDALRLESVATVLLHPGKADAPAMLARLLHWAEANDAWVTSAARFIGYWRERARAIEERTERADGVVAPSRVGSAGRC